MAVGNMLEKICFVGLMLTLLVKVSSQQSCTCAAFDACLQPLRDSKDSCLSSCKSKLTTSGSSQCFSTQEVDMDRAFDCAKPCNMKRKRRQFNGPFGGPFGGPGGPGGPGGHGGFGFPGGPGGFPGGFGFPGGPGGFGPFGPSYGWQLKGNAATEINAYNNCINTCISSNNPFQCVQQLNCPFPSKQSCFNNINQGTICTCLQGVYGASNVVC